MRVENCLAVLQRVTGNGGDLRHAGAFDRKANHRLAAQIIKRQAVDAGSPDHLCGPPLEAAAAFTWAAMMPRSFERRDARKRRPGMLGLAGCLSERAAPDLEFTTPAAVGQSCDFGVNSPSCAVAKTPIANGSVLRLTRHTPLNVVGRSSRA